MVNLNWQEGNENARQDSVSAVSGVIAFAVILILCVGSVRAQYANWTDQQQITLNTGPSGADVTGNVTDFPILVRLDADNFPFAEAQPNGEDIRFAVSTTPIPYQIERWNAELERAEVWVKVPTILGNDSTQAITMFWGNTAATTESNGVAVFDTLNGFKMVFHLQEDGNTTINGYANATQYDQDATGFKLTGTSDIDAAVGVGQKFNAVDTGYIVIENDGLPESPPDGFGAMMWFRRDGEITSDLTAAMERGYDDYCFTFNPADDKFYHRTKDDTIVDLTTPQTTVLGQWYLASLSYNVADSTMRFYLDGSLLQSTKVIWGGFDHSANQRVTLGVRNLTTAHFPGAVDEFRVEKVARSNDWHKLCYENQKASSTFLVFGELAPDSIAPSFLVQPASISRTEGQSASFTASASGYPSPTYRWRKNGVDLANGGTVSGCATGTLVISSVVFADSGSYVCAAMNPKDTVFSNAAKMTVTEAPGIPKIQTQPQSQNSYYNSDVTFSVEATATPPINNYKWYKNGAEIAGENGASYTISSVDFSDSGSYTVAISNSTTDSNGTPVVSAPAILRVICHQATITTDPRDTTVVAGSTVAFRVTATGTGIVYEWQSRAGGVWSSIGNGGNSAVYSTLASKAFNGYRYRCIVSDLCGGLDTSTVATLSVLDETPPDVSPDFDLTVIPSVTFMRVRWTTPESPSTDVEHVLVCYSLTDYPTFGDAAKDTLAQVSPLATAGGQDTVLAGLAAKTRYYFSVFLLDSSGNQVRADTASSVTSSAGEPFNPMTVSGTLIDSTHVRIVMSGFTGVPSWDYAQGLPLIFTDTTYADTVGVWWSSAGFPQVPSRGALESRLYSLYDMQRSSETFVDTVVVEPLDMDIDSIYWFNVSLFWKNPDSIIAFDVANGSPVDMVDRRAPLNPLQLSGAYLDVAGNDSVTISLANIDSVEAGIVDRVIIRLAGDSAGFDEIAADTLLFSDVLAASADNVFSYGVVNSRFDGRRDTVHCFVRVISRNDVVSSVVQSYFVTGHEIPANPVNLTATAIGPTRIVLLWNNLGAVEAFRIVYDTVPIVQNSEIDPAEYVGILSPFASAFVDTLKGRQPQTRYYFGAQVQVKGLWSYVSAAASANAKTLSVDTSLTVENSIVITKAFFDAAGNRIGVIWTRDTTEDSLEYGIAYGLDSVEASGAVPEWLETAGNSPDTAWIQPGADLVFDSTYHVFMQLRIDGGIESGVRDSAHVRVVTPSFTFQPVSYFLGNDESDTVQVDRSRFLMWHEEKWMSGLIQDTIRSVAIDPEQRDGFVVVGKGYQFAAGRESQPVSIGLSWSELPVSTVAIANVRLYRFDPSTGLWTVEWDGVVDAAHNRVWVTTRSLRGSAFALAVDTTEPQLTVLSDDSSRVFAWTELVNRVHVVDNVANGRVIFRFAKGADAWGTSTDTLLLNGTDTTLVLTVGKAAVTDDNGARVHVVADDGASVVKSDLSRQVVLRESTIDLSVDADTWTPIHAVADLDDKDALEVLLQLVPGADKDWVYDNTRVRLFRWLDHRANSNQTSDWLEYAPMLGSLFDLEPGRVLWVKAKESGKIDYGDGATLSLKDTVSIVIPGSRGNKQGWLDFAVPYKFNMYVGDILDATDDPRDSSLQFYHWEQPVGAGDVYTTELVYYGKGDMAQWKDRRTVLTGGMSGGDAFSVYNPNADSVVLRFPPTPTSLSSVVSAELAKSVSAAGWYVQIQGSGFSPVYAGFSQPAGQVTGTTWYPRAPSFSVTGVSSFDRQTHREAGHVFAHSAVDGGNAYELLLYNRDSRDRTLSWNVDRANVPRDKKVMVWMAGAEDGVVVEDRAGFEQPIAAGQDLHAFVLVGDETYFEGFRHGVSATKFALMRVFPNPVCGAVTIRFSVPYYGVNSVLCSVLDMQGRVLWHRTVENTTAGVNEIVWDGIGVSGSRVAAGMYMLQVSATNSSGKMVGRKKERLVVMSK